MSDNIDEKYIKECIAYDAGPTWDDVMTALVKIDTRTDTPTKEKKDKENKSSRTMLSKEELESAKVYETHGLAMLNDMLASDSLKTSLLAGNTAQEDFITMALLYCKAAALKLGYVVKVERTSFQSLNGSLHTMYKLRLERLKLKNIQRGDTNG